MTVRSTLGRFGIVTVAAIQAINAHPDGSSSVLALYVALSTHADRDEMQAWRCSVKALAEEAGISERSVRSAKAVLVELGLIETTMNYTPDGDRGWDSYLIHFAPSGGPADSAPPPAPDAAGADDVAGYSSDQETDQETDNLPAPSSDGAVEVLDSDDMEFEWFWVTYRRTGPKKKAKECWKRARKKATAEEILRGLEEWMSYWDSPGAASIKWPQGWLNEERWNDQPPIHTITAQTQKKETGMDALRRLANQENAS